MGVRNFTLFDMKDSTDIEILEKRLDAVSDMLANGKERYDNDFIIEMMLKTLRRYIAKDYARAMSKVESPIYVQNNRN